MNSMSTFQLVVTGIFITLIVLGVGTFALLGGLLGNSAIGAVTIWGTEDQQIMDQTLQTLRSSDKDFQEVTYVQKSESSYEDGLVNAIASGSGPDLFMMTQEELGMFSNKITAIPYSAVSQSAFTNSYVDETRVFLNGQGSWALPILIDPLVMYYNRDLLATAGVAQPPSYWNDLLDIAPKITSLDASQNVRKSAVALGTWDNVAHAKAILSALFMQAGDQIVGLDNQGYLASVFGQSVSGDAENPSASALRFYTEFANPSKTTYSWNRSLQNSTVAFSAGDVALYFGYASELGAISGRNPNLRFGVAPLPQLQGASVSTTYGVVTGLAIPRSAANPKGALTIARKLSSQAGVEALVTTSGLPPVRRDVAVDTSSNSYAQVFSQSALIARGWFDPDASASSRIWQGMVESVLTGKEDPAAAVSEAAQEFTDLFHQQQ